MTPRNAVPVTRKADRAASVGTPRATSVLGTAYPVPGGTRRYGGQS